MKRILIVTLILMSAFTAFSKNDKEKADSIQKLIEDKSFVFVAQSALPLRGSFISLTPPYDLKVAKDTIEAYLPYFGRAYSGVFPGNDNGIKFTSTKNTYKVEKNKHGWDVTIKPEDIQYGIELYFTISENGYAMLRVSDNRRDPITFNGYVVKEKE